MSYRRRSCTQNFKTECHAAAELECRDWVEMGASMGKRIEEKSQANGSVPSNCEHHGGSMAAPRRTCGFIRS